MKERRIVSYGAESHIYHKPGCRYAKRILPKNYMEMSKEDARANGYRSCRCCNSMNYHYSTEFGCIDFFERKKDMQFRYINGILYVKTAVSCWKLVYCRKNEKMAIYHRNRNFQPVNFNRIQDEQYHRQGDIQYVSNINRCLNYIYDHDRYKEAQTKGEVITFTSKSSQKRADRSRKKSERRRLDNLFLMLEEQNKGYKKLSFC